MKHSHLSTVAALGLLLSSSLAYGVDQGFYTGLGVHYTTSNKESDTPGYQPELMHMGFDNYRINSRGLGHINKVFGIHLLEGYRVNPKLAAEVDAIFYGQNSDVLAAYAVYTPKRLNHSAFHVKAGMSYSDHVYLPGAGLAIEWFTSAQDSLSISGLYQPTVVYGANTSDCGFAPNNMATICSQNTSDKKRKLGAYNVGLTYQHAFAPRAKVLSDHTSDLNHYFSVGMDQAATTYPINYDESQRILYKWSHDAVNLNITQGFSFSPYYAFETSLHYFSARGDELRKKHFMMASFDHRLMTPRYGGGLFDAHLKLGSFYSNERRGGLSYGFGLDFYDGPRSLAVAWQRMDYRNATIEPAPHFYHDLFGLKAAYALYPSVLSPPEPPVMKQQLASVYLDFTTASHSGLLTETSEFVVRDHALSGYEGLFTFGYRIPVASHWLLGTELSLGTSSAVDYETRRPSDSSLFSMYGSIGRDLAYYASVVPSYQLPSGVSLQGRLGVARSAWSVDLSPGLVAGSHSHQNGGLQSSTQNLSVNGIVFGFGERIALNNHLSLLLHYDHSVYRSHNLVAAPIAEIAGNDRLTHYSGKVFHFKPEEDRFGLGIDYQMKSNRGSSHPLHYQRSGAYFTVMAERDFHYIKRQSRLGQFGLDVRDDDFHENHFYLNGEAGRFASGYQWVLPENLILGLELYGRLNNSEHRVEKVFRKESWRYATNHSVGGDLVLGYEFSPGIMPYAHVGLVTSEFERSGDEAPRNEVEYNFRKNTEGFRYGFGSDVSLNHHLGLRFDVSSTEYEGFGDGDTKLKGSNDFIFIKASDITYALGLRYLV